MKRLVGRYEIRERIGQGAMASVYRAFDPGIDRELAIKVLKREFSKDAEYAQRFTREAKAAGALSHPNIVTIYDVGAVGGFPYIAMELLDGETLDAVVARGGKLDAARVLSIATQLGDALRYAHGQGVVHRDIKPSNIMLCHDGRTVKILDFGIARFDEVAAGETSTRTQLGQIVGTPRYMSPEQALGRPVDGRADLFSVGAVLYELVTGRQAFDAGTIAALALQITSQDPPPIAQSAPDCPPGLGFIIAKLLEKIPDKRFRDGEQLLEALERERAAHDASLLEASGRHRYLSLQARQVLMLAGATALALALSIGAVLHTQYGAMERVAITSGSSITSFIAANAAVHVASNAALPPAQQDWLPVQAFARTASEDPNINGMIIADGGGIIRAASDERLVGQAYHAPREERVVLQRGELRVTSKDKTFRFVQPIEYAGRRFGSVEVGVSRAELSAAADLTKALLLGLALVTLGVVAAASYAIGRQLAAPVGRLRNALKEAEHGNLDFRISHMRRDEFGDLFDAFNRFLQRLQERGDPGPSPPDPGERSLDATRIGGFASNALDQTILAAPASDDRLRA